MTITASQIKEIRLEFAKLKPVKVTLDDNRSLTVKEAVNALAPTLEKLKEKGFKNQQLVELLHEKGIEVKPPTLTKYLNEFRRGKDKKRDTPPLPTRTEKAAPVPVQQPDRPGRADDGGFTITPDTPLNEL